MYSSHVNRTALKEIGLPASKVKEIVISLTKPGSGADTTAPSFRYQSEIKQAFDSRNWLSKHASGDT